MEDASREWEAAGDTGDDWEVEVAQDSELASPNFHSTPLKLSTLGRILGHTVGEYAESRIVEGRQLWTINYAKLLNRGYVRHDDLASPWRIECYSDRTLKCVLGAAYEVKPYTF